MDLIGKVNPFFSQIYGYVIVVTDYFTKWVKAKPMKRENQSHVIQFIKENIEYRFGIPESVTTNMRMVFTG